MVNWMNQINTLSSTYLSLTVCSLLPSASGFGVGFGYLNTLGNKVFAALGHRNHQVSGVCSQRVERKDAKSVDAW